MSSPPQCLAQRRFDTAMISASAPMQIHPTPGDTVTSVAILCGYRSQSRFRIDFERTYDWKPSAVLRGAVVSSGSSSTSSLAP